MVVVNKYSSTQITSLTSTSARMVYDTTLNALRFNNSASYANVLVAKDLANNLSGINNVVTTGSLGLNTTTPSKQLEVNSATGDCLRMSYNSPTGSATNFVDLMVTSDGDLTMTPSGGSINITSHNGADKGLKLAGVLVTSTAAELNYVDTTPGSAQASKALVVDANRNLINMNYLETASLATVAVSATNSSTVSSLSVITIPTTAAAAGIGAGVEFDLVSDEGNVFAAGFVNCVSSSVVDGSEKAFFEYQLINSGSLDTIMTVSNAGVLTATTFVETSDLRVKENILAVPEQESLDKLMQLNIKSYNYTFDSEKKPHTGVIAQEIAEVLPEVVQVEKKGDIEDFHSVHYAGLVPHLVNAVKQLKKELDELKSSQASKQ
jgi:hypothetical protein